MCDRPSPTVNSVTKRAFLERLRSKSVIAFLALVEATSLESFTQRSPFNFLPLDGGGKGGGELWRMNRFTHILTFPHRGVRNKSDCLSITALTATLLHSIPQFSRNLFGNAIIRNLIECHFAIRKLARSLKRLYDLVDTLVSRHAVAAHRLSIDRVSIFSD